MAVDFSSPLIEHTKTLLCKASAFGRGGVGMEFWAFVKIFSPATWACEVAFIFVYAFAGVIIAITMRKLYG